MKIVLISPLPVYDEIPQPFWVPLGLAFIASMLRKDDHCVSIFDRYAVQTKFGIDRNKINTAMIEHVKKFNPDLIGLQTKSPLIYDTVESVKLIRNFYRGLIVAGGHHATAFPEITLEKIQGLDGVVLEEGEIPMARIANGEDLSSIPGVWWKNSDASIVHTLPEQNTNLDILPFPALDLLDMDFYARPGINAIRGYYLPTVSFLTSRGCVQRCEFCSESLTYGKGVRFHSPEYVIDWIKHVLTDYHIQGIYFHDNDFLLRESRVRDICEKLISTGLHRKIKWAIQARANRINKDIVKLLKRAGCVLIEVGVESSSQNQLNGINKNTTVDVSEKAIALCKKEGLSIHAYMMTGFAGETKADLQEKLQWLKTTKPNSFIWSPLMIYPGTILYEKHGQRFFEENDWNRENIEGYYRNGSLSCISKEERDKWMNKHFWPYLVWQTRLNTLKVNLFFRIILYIFSKRKKWLEFMVQLFRLMIKGKNKHKALQMKN